MAIRRELAVRPPAPLQASLGMTALCTKYADCMANVQEYLVSSSGQLSLPAAARHRWDLDQGGPVDVLDL
ncbi:MAG TPA: hypothetical protein VGF87_06440, partial [Acidimicrobiales bacterium]